MPAGGASCAGATSTSAWRWCRWSPTAASPCPRTGRPADVLRLDPDAPRPGRPARRGARRSTATRCASSRRRSAAGSAARPASAPSTRPSPPRRGRSAARSTWVPTRSEDLVSAAPQSRPGAVRRAGRRRRRARSEALRVRLLGDAGAYPSIGAYLPGRHQADVERDVPVRCDPVRRRGRRDQHHADRRLSRRRAPRGDRPARAPGRPGRPRAGHRPDRAAPAQPDRRRRVPVHDAHSGAAYDSGDYAAAARRRGRRRRLRRPARGAGAASCRRRPGAARHRRRRRTWRSPPAATTASSARVEVHEDGSATVRAGTLSHGQGHQTAFAMLVERPHRHPGRADHPRRRRHRPRATRRRHRRLAVAADRRVGGRSRRRWRWSSGHAAWPRRCSRPTWPTSSSTRPAGRSASPACRPRR